MIDGSSLSSSLGQPHALGARQAGGRLVEHHQLRVARRAPCRPRAGAARRARARTTSTSSALAEADGVGHRARLLAHLGVRAWCGPAGGGPRCDAEHRQVQVVLDGQAEEQPGRLERAREAHAGALARRQRRSRRCRTARPCPAVGGNSPEIRLNSVVLPAPLGPRMARRSPGRDLEVHVADGVDAAEAPADPPQAEDRLGAARRMSLVLPLLPYFDEKSTSSALPTHGGGSSPASHFGFVRSGGGVSGVNVPPNVWSTPGTCADRLHVRRPCRRWCRGRSP